MNYLISIIVPIYKVEKYLSRCIESIIQQTYKNIEIILINDGSPDSCLSICERYKKLDSRIKIIDKVNGGVSSARNAGLDIATGDYIGFVDSDDYIEKDMYEVLLNSIIKNNVKVCQININIIDEISGKKYNSSDAKSEGLITSEDYLRDFLLHKGDTSVWSKLYKREVVEGIRFQEGKLNEDLLFMLEVLEKTPNIYCCSNKKYNYLRREGSITKSGFSKIIIDMVDNSTWILENVKDKHKNLVEEAERLYFYQRLVYMIRITKEEMNSYNCHYVKTLCEIKENRIKIIKNKYIEFKYKIALIGVSLVPRVFKYIISTMKK